jgi:hypothetical protein
VTALKLNGSRVTPLTVTPVAEATATVVPTVKLVPFKDTGTAVLRTPVFGLMDMSVGAAGLMTVNVTVLLVAPLAVTLTAFAPRIVVGAMTKLAVTKLSFTTVRLV